MRVQTATFFVQKEAENERKVAAIKSLKEKNVFQGHERETLVQRKVEIDRD